MDSATRRNDIESKSKVKEQREWIFKVFAPNINKSEVICVSGNCNALGNWSHDKVVLLKKEHDSSFWLATIKIPLNKEIHFRYCVCLVTSTHRQVLIRQWETHCTPRKITNKSIQLLPIEPDLFGMYDGIRKVDKGWLTTGSILQLKFYSDPFIFNSMSLSSWSVKLTPLKSKFYFSSPSPHAYMEGFVDGDPDPISNVVIEVAILDDIRSAFKPQDPFGCIVNAEDFLIFNITVPNAQDISYLLDFYTRDAADPVHFGFSYILPSVSLNSEGLHQLPIMCVKKQNLIGMLNMESLVIRPMSTSLCNIKESYSSHWSKSWTGLDVGHRGSGSSFKTEESAAIRENTIASLKQAAASGADLVEFDVQLSKDFIPVIYHDFHVCVALRVKNQLEYPEVLEIPMMDLTLEQLQKLKIYHLQEKLQKEPRFFDEDLIEHQPFPLLSDVLEVIDPNVGFNIEIKWNLKQEDGTTDLQNTIDINVYVDKILEVVLKSNNKRKIVFSCFNPDVCTMIRLKQNIYPTMFLTQGVSKKYPKLYDFRCNSIPDAIHHAHNARLLGLVVHTEDLLRDSTQVKLVLDAGLIIFCWGDDNNSKDTINYLKKLGLHGVIFDRLHEFSTKKVKESIFMMEAREMQKVSRTTFKSSQSNKRNVPQSGCEKIRLKEQGDIPPNNLGDILQSSLGDTPQSGQGDVQNQNDIDLVKAHSSSKLE